MVDFLILLWYFNAKNYIDLVKQGKAERVGV